MASAEAFRKTQGIPGLLKLKREGQAEASESCFRSIDGCRARVLRVLAHTFLSVSMCRAVVTCLQCSLPSQSFLLSSLLLLLAWGVLVDAVFALVVVKRPLSHPTPNTDLMLYKQGFRRKDLPSHDTIKQARRNFPELVQPDKATEGPPHHTAGYSSRHLQQHVKGERRVGT